MQRQPWGARPWIPVSKCLEVFAPCPAARQGETVRCSVGSSAAAAEVSDSSKSDHWAQKEVVDDEARCLGLYESLPLARSMLSTRSWGSALSTTFHGALLGSQHSIGPLESAHSLREQPKRDPERAWPSKRLTTRDTSLGYSDAAQVAAGGLGHLQRPLDRHCDDLECRPLHGRVRGPRSGSGVGNPFALGRAPAPGWALKSVVALVLGESAVGVSP